MRITIGGDDDVALRLAEALMVEHAVTLIIPEKVRGTQLDRLDVQVVSGSTTSGDVLAEAGVGDAELFVACTSLDERNLIACAEAKHLGAAEALCFLRSHDVQSSEEDAKSLANALKIDQVVLPAAQLAMEILKIVMVPGALDAGTFAGNRVRLAKRRIEEGAHMAGRPLKEVGVPKGVVLVMGQRGKESFIPNGETVFQPGDKLTAMGSLSGINRLVTRWLADRSTGADPRRATVVGGGVVGFAVTEGLEKAGWEVKLIEADERRANRIAPQLKSLVLHGDGTNLELLREERIGEAPVLIAVTSNDEKNLLVSLLARQQGVARIITRADTETNEQLFEQVGIDVVRSALGAAVSKVVRHANRADRDLEAEFEHGDVVVLKLLVPEHVTPVQLAKMRAPVFAIVGAIVRDQKVIIPQGRDTVQGGDELLVFCKADAAEDTRRYFEDYGRKEG